jgi:hypothetical protein
MTLAELHRMRKIRAKPAMAIVMTDDERIHRFCAENDLPVIWTHGLAPDADLSCLHGLQVWMIVLGAYSELADKINEHNPADLWIAGYYGFIHRVGSAIGRPIWIS